MRRFLGYREFRPFPAHGIRDYDDNWSMGCFWISPGSDGASVFTKRRGRQAIQFLVQVSDDDAVAGWQPATDDVLWSRMKDVGQPGFGELFPGLAAPLVGRDHSRLLDDSMVGRGDVRNGPASLPHAPLWKARANPPHVR